MMEVKIRVMGLFDSNDKKDDPLVLNFAQTLEKPDRFLFGKVMDNDNLPENQLPIDKTEKNGESRTVVNWLPHDAEHPEDVTRQESSVLSRHHVVIGQGEMSPRKIHVLFPDSFKEVSDEFTGEMGQKEAMRKLGMVIAQFYQSQAARKALEIVADNESQVFDKVEKNLKNSQLDDELSQMVQQEIDQATERAKQMKSSSSSDS